MVRYISTPLRLASSAGGKAGAGRSRPFRYLPRDSKVLGFPIRGPDRRSSRIQGRARARIGNEMLLWPPEPLAFGPNRPEPPGPGLGRPPVAYPARQVPDSGLPGLQARTLDESQ